MVTAMGYALAMGPTGRLRLEDDAKARGSDISVVELRSSLAISNAPWFRELSYRHRSKRDIPQTEPVGPSQAGQPCFCITEAVQLYSHSIHE